MASAPGESVRRRNLSAVLELVHRGGAPSRAELTALTGLNRSTIGALVAELEALGLVTETDPASSNRVGRPSPRVEPAKDVAVVSANPEVDAVTVGIVGLDARVRGRVRQDVPAPPTPEETARIIAELTERLLDQEGSRPRILGVGLAVPGLVRSRDGLVRWAPHLDWRDVPLPDVVGDALGLPTFAGNDATLGARAEWLFGAGRGVEELVYLNGGASGIGGGVIVRGHPLGGAHGYAGEFGQNRPGLRDADDRSTPAGVLEDEVSRARLLATVGLDTADEPTLREHMLASSSPAVAAEVERQQRILAVALANAVNVFNPERVVLGGFLATLLEWESPALERLVEASSVASAFEGVDVLPAALGEDRLLIGAAELAVAPVLADPTSLG
ncbi:ROK family transcriptional regulator [Salinibacterium soli]|uniref:ROK family transcriptional regulator n=1 Tax=Antiquaquibacter soli TaxID=3064523 RepID=A0ABT9BKB3_9MICO|nr:ROK family transcriptional regulator [Protaetiibacter sp. WY-16]MDO7880989.1 ROK family transcriptional regulator [Protaetiibacter sp. WY-16]